MADIAERISSFVDPLHALLGEYTAKFEQKCVELQGEGKPLTSKEKRALKMEYGRRYLKAARDYTQYPANSQQQVSEPSGPPQARCYKCGCNCPIHPEDLNGRLCMVIGGNSTVETLAFRGAL
jgi:hypothetical protein